MCRNSSVILKSIGMRRLLPIVYLFLCYVNAWPHLPLKKVKRTVLKGASPKEWLTEGLERAKFDSKNTARAGEDDLLPEDGLRIGRLHIIPAGMDDIRIHESSKGSDGIILLGNSENGWGTGCHPSTRLCVEFLSSILCGGENVLDYGTGSGILAIASLKLGASYVTAVDVDAEVLVTAEQNFELNQVEERASLLHVREVVPGSLVPGADIAVANILVGQLVRSSMVAALCSNIRPGGLLCLSGVRPTEVSSLMEAYNEWIDWDETYYAEAKPGPEGEHYWGTWSRVVGRRKIGVATNSLLGMLSEQAVA